MIDDRTYRRSDDVLTGRIHPEAVIMSMTDGNYFSLNETAARVWDLLDAPSGVDKIVQVLVAEYRIEDSECRQQVTALIDDFVRRGLVTAA